MNDEQNDTLQTIFHILESVMNEGISREVENIEECLSWLKQSFDIE